MAKSPIPTVHRNVHYFDREEIVNAAQQKRTPEPFAAIITRVHRDLDGQPTNVVSLAVFDPEIGYQVKHNVHLGEDYRRPEAHRWYWTPYQAAGQAPPPPPGTDPRPRLTLDPGAAERRDQEREAAKNNDDEQDGA